MTASQPTPSSLPFKVIGVTGSIASGKTTFAKSLEALGATVIDADVLARDVVKPGTPGLTKLVEHFGARILSGTELNRSALAGIIFFNDVERQWVEQLLHPLIRAQFQALLATLSKQVPPPPLVVYVAPLLLEAGVPEQISLTVLVSAPEAELIRRAVARGGISEEQARARLAKQMSDSEKRKKVGLVIENAGSREELDRAATDLFQSLRNNKNP